MHDTFQRAIRPEPRFHCLGVALQPLTLGHLFLLQELESPVLKQYTPIELGDLLLAVAACSRPHDVASKQLRSGMLSVRAWIWGARVSHKLRRNEMCLTEEAQTFWRYLSEETARPPMQPAKDGGRSLVTPDEWRLLDMLLGRYHMLPETCMALPVITANCLWAAAGEADGKITLAVTDATGESVVSRLTRRAKELEATI